MTEEAIISSRIEGTITTIEEILAPEGLVVISAVFPVCLITTIEEILAPEGYP